MNPNISALFTFPNKRFPGNPGSRPEPAWSLVPDAIMVNSPFVDIQEVFFKQILQNIITPILFIKFLKNFKKNHPTVKLNNRQSDLMIFDAGL